MPDTSPPRSIPQQILDALLGSKWAKVFGVLLALFAFAEAGIALYTSLQQARKLTAEAESAALNVPRSKAEQCSAMTKAIIDATPQSELPAALAKLTRECGSDTLPLMKTAATVSCDTFYIDLATSVHTMDEHTAFLTAFKKACPYDEAKAQAAMAVLRRIGPREAQAAILCTKANKPGLDCAALTYDQQKALVCADATSAATYRQDLDCH